MKGYNPFRGRLLVRVSILLPRPKSYVNFGLQRKP
jgi:hypothetical protein